MRTDCLFCSITGALALLFTAAQPQAADQGKVDSSPGTIHGAVPSDPVTEQTNAIPGVDPARLLGDFRTEQGSIQEVPVPDAPPLLLTGAVPGVDPQRPADSVSTVPGTLNGGVPAETPGNLDAPALGGDAERAKAAPFGQVGLGRTALLGGPADQASEVAGQHFLPPRIPGNFVAPVIRALRPVVGWDSTSETKCGVKCRSD
ncbi:MAG: hypothetical protein AB9869_19580 [Verrucomicrobiia bacterium]